MNKVVVGVIAGLVVGAGGAWLALPHFGESEPAKAAPAATDKPKENPLRLDAAKRAAAGITLAKPVGATLAPEVNAFGRVLDATPLVALVAELETAKSSLAASQKSAERARELFHAGANASAQALETAEAAAARDRAALASARARLIASWGRRLADMADLKTLGAGLEAGAALVRLDVLPGDAPATAIKQASVGLLGGREMLGAEILGPAPVADPQLPGAGFLALVTGHALPTGAALRATLSGQGESVKALVLSRDAIVYHQGSAWVFVLEKDDTFERKRVTLGRSVGDGVAITSGVDDSDQVVTTGAGQLLSAELQAGGEPGEH